ncbi:hypothetical protein LPJ66_004295 [Kickxella alabastrina]|uniref:Uncharacterized protein n=1 Tax=Kickxella alabastrina TaxID=61397 RepID=A0ACC1IIC4_9FUNG|nr:hypothetical protein LPJ66_004295 [Kickxella alabastrina]
MDVNTLAPRIREILQISDLSTVSAKKVRRQLEHEMNATLDAYKGEIDEIIKHQFQQIHSENQQRQQAQQQYAHQYAQQQGQMGVYGVGAPGGLPGLQMPPNGYANVHLPPSMPPAMVHGSAAAQASAQPPPPAAEDAAPRKRGRPRKPENEKKQQRKKRVVDPDKPKRQTGLSKPMKLSADLGAFLGQKYCARTDVVKNLWKYIKEKDLQDPADKRYILCDTQLKTLFEVDRLYMYTMNKLLNQHLVKPTPEENAEAIALLGLPPTHPAAADSAGLLPPASAVAAGAAAAAAAVVPSGSVAAGAPAAPDSPAYSDVGTPPSTGTQYTADSAEEDDDQSNPVSPNADHHHHQHTAQNIASSGGAAAAAPLTLPPHSSNTNGN